MNQITRTSIFLGVAAVSVGLAVLVGLASRPGDTAGGYDVGTEFFPGFDDPLAATALRVASFNEGAGRPVVFQVEERGGVWRIPSHHNYPADGEDRLEKTATSMLRVERGALVSTSPDDHRLYSVLDPLDDSVFTTEGRGDRITLYENDSVLFDLIIGEAVEDQPDVYYVRRPDETQIYRAVLGTIDLSAKFADWIEQDLLEINSSDLVEMVVDPYHIDEVQGLKVQDEDPILLERKPATSSWVLAGIDESQEQEKVSVINAMSRALADLEIVGVRRKPESLIALFRGEQDVRLSRSEMIQMQNAGFFVIPPGEFVANEGEVQAGTNDGIRYRLQFGEVFTGTEVEIEVGSSTEPADEEEATDEDAGGDDATENDGEVSEDEADAEGGSEVEETDSSLQRSRYLFVSVLFDESLIGERPEPPVPPTPPGDDPAPAESESGDAETPVEDSSAASESETDAAVEDAGAGETPAESAEGPDGDEAANSESDAGTDADADADDPAADQPATEGDDADAPETPTAQELYEMELEAYEVARGAYETELAEYEEKIEAGNKRADELNQRYAEWYYVIPADQYENLKVSRADLVEPAESSEPTDGATDGPDLDSLLEGLPSDDAPNETPSADEQAAPSEDSPTADDSTSSDEGTEEGEAESASEAEPSGPADTTDNAEPPGADRESAPDSQNSTDEEQTH